jgi:uncharacterized caspase-like protein
VYYSGHGAEVNGENYLIPVGFHGTSTGDVQDHAYPLRLLLGRLDESAAQVKVVLLDACRDNPFRNSRGGGKGLAAPAGLRSGTLIGYAAQAGAIAADGQGLHSPYASALIEELPKRTLSLQQALNRVSRTAAQIAAMAGEAQEPAYYISGFVPETYLK